MVVVKVIVNRDGGLRLHVKHIVTACGLTGSYLGLDFYFLTAGALGVVLFCAIALRMFCVPSASAQSFDAVYLRR